MEQVIDEAAALVEDAVALPVALPETTEAAELAPNEEALELVRIEDDEMGARLDEITADELRALDDPVLLLLAH